ncbi:hypothetical protein CGLO_14903 [Colletotrichum gloeosporioides Cg-14]|uniref:Uncharacterized protein n=1 Tax=Colletotrichum gloeosporioides (strain Cg-14) TaxID=1237896 RepID=T0LCN2_COLGC|nr:hypothetical protein CGLO_14903 [Colletotrichum gloeosporioides Cg-14]
MTLIPTDVPATPTPRLAESADCSKQSAQTPAAATPIQRRAPTRLHTPQTPRAVLFGTPAMRIRPTTFARRVVQDSNDMKEDEQEDVESREVPSKKDLAAERVAIRAEWAKLEAAQRQLKIKELEVALEFAKLDNAKAEVEGDRLKVAEMARKLGRKIDALPDGKQE